MAKVFKDIPIGEPFIHSKVWYKMEIREGELASCDKCTFKNMSNAICSHIACQASERKDKTACYVVECNMFGGKVKNKLTQIIQ
jgi:hypothetical protein